MFCGLMGSMDEAGGLIYIHGLEGTSHGTKATLLRGLFPEMLIPDFRGSLDERMITLETLLGAEREWTIIGSSFGGLMGAMFTCQCPHQVRKLVLLAPALIWPDFADHLPEPVEVATVIYHGKRDSIVPLKPVRALAQQVFTNLDFRVVEDEHSLRQTIHAIDWHRLLGRA